MGTRTSLILGAFAILALLAAGVSYWALRENSPSGPSPRNIAEAPPPPIQSPPAPENSPPVRQEKPTAESAAPQTTPTSKESTASTAPSGPTTAAAQPTEAPAPPNSPSTAAPGQSREGTEVDPVSWTPEHLCSRSPRWRRRDHLTLLSSVARWSSWCVLAARQRNWQGSSNRPRSRSRTGSVRLSATPAAARAV